MADNWQLGMKEALSRMKGDRYEDFTILCDGQQFKVHSLIVCMHSPVLEKMCRGPFKETKEKIIDLSDDNTSAVAALINWFYLSEYTHPDDRFELEFDCMMVILADKYDVKHLKKTSTERFTKRCETATDDELVSAAAVAYDVLEATKDIRPLLVEHIVQRKSWEPGPHLETPTAGSTMLAWDLVAAMKKGVDLKPKAAVTTFKCSACGTKIYVELVLGNPKSLSFCGQCSYSGQETVWTSAVCPKSGCKHWAHPMTKSE